jgi:hypothetical protein
LQMNCCASQDVQSKMIFRSAKYPGARLGPKIIFLDCALKKKKKRLA